MKGGGQQGQSGQGMDALYIAAFFVLFCGIMWWKFKPEIVSAIFSVRLAEISLIEIFLDLAADIATWLHLPHPDVATLERWTDFMENTDPATVTGNDLYIISSDVCSYLAVPVFIVSVLLGSALFFYHSASMYNNIYI